MKNKWFDKENKVYIIYQITEIQEDLGFFKKKAIDYLTELEKFGLIEKKKRGFGLLNIIYVKSFMVQQSFFRSLQTNISERCKNYLNLSKECNSLSYDAMAAHTAVVFTRYMMLSLESRESNDNRSLGELFLYFSDEMSDITWIQAFQMLLQMFRTMLSDNTELSDEKINKLVDTFMNTLPIMLKTQLQ